MSNFSYSIEQSGKSSSIEEPSYVKPLDPIRRGFTVNENIQKIFSFSGNERRDDAISVYIRLKPLDSSQKTNFLSYNEDENSVMLMKKNVEHTFKFTHVFGPESTQTDIFDTCAKPYLQRFLNGHNAFIFTYGASSSGKTYTVQGQKNSPGLIPRILVSLFCSLEDFIDNECPLSPELGSDVVELTGNNIDERLSIKNRILNLAKHMLPSSQNSKVEGFIPFSEFENILHDAEKLSVGEQRGVYSIWFSYYEIYNEKVFDMFDERIDKKPLRLLADKTGTISIKGLRQIPVKTLKEAFWLYSFGRLNLSVSSTGVNDRSSRSHSVFTIKIIGRPPNSSSTYFLTSSYSICDLAGTERAQKTKNEGIRLREAQQINSSFLVLNRCLRIIRENQNSDVKRHVPYRESKLTQILGPSLTSQDTLLVMIVTASQSYEFFEETESVLKSSSVATAIKAISPPRSRPKKKMRFSMAISKCKPGRGADWAAIACAKKNDENIKIHGTGNFVESSNGQSATCISSHDHLYTSGFAPDVYKELEMEKQKNIAAQEKILELEKNYRKELADLEEKLMFGEHLKSIKHLEKKLQEQEEEYMESRTEVLKLKKNIRLLKEVIEEKDRNIKGLEDRNENYKEMLDDAKEEVELLQEEVLEMDNLMKTNDEVIAMKDERIASLELELMEKSATISALEDELRNKQEEFDDFFRNYQVLEEELKNRSDELQELLRNHQVTLQEMFSMQKISSKLGSENSHCMKQLQKVIEENCNYKKQIENLNAKLKSYEGIQFDPLLRIGMVLKEKQKEDISQKGTENYLKGKENILVKPEKESQYALREARIPRIIVQEHCDESLDKLTPRNKNNARSRSEDRQVSFDSSEDLSFVMNSKSKTAIKKKRRPRKKKNLNLNIPDYGDVSSTTSDATSTSETGDTLKYRRKLFMRSSADLSNTVNMSIIDDIKHAQPSPETILKRTLRTGKMY